MMNFRGDFRIRVDRTWWIGHENEGKETLDSFKLEVEQLGQALVRWGSAVCVGVGNEKIKNSGIDTLL